MFKIKDGVRVEMTTAEIAEVNRMAEEALAALPAQQAESVRGIRNNMLTETDWTQIADATVDKAAWATYRQALRDITAHENFPALAEDDWPTKP